MYVYLYCSARHAWSTHMFRVCNVYDTASSREACGCVQRMFFMYIFPRQLQSQEINPVQEQEIISVYCLCHQLQSRRMLKCSVCGEHYHRHSCVSWKEKSQSFAVKVARRKNSVPACGCRSTISHLISSFVFISSANPTSS